MPERGIDFAIKKWAVQLGTVDQREEAFSIPDMGSPDGLGGLIGLHFTLTLTNTAAAASTLNYASIMDSIQRMEIQSEDGESLLDLTGDELSVMSVFLTRRGVDNPPPLMAATAAGASDLDDPDGDRPANTVSVYSAFLPFSIARADMIAKVIIEWSPLSKLYGALANPPTTNVTLSLRGLYSFNADVYTVNIETFAFKLDAGTNALNERLPKGRFVEGLVLFGDHSDIPNRMVDASIDYIRLVQDGYTLIDSAPVAEVFAVDDKLERADGHVDGVIIYRGPFFDIDESTRLTLKATAAGANKKGLIGLVHRTL